MASKTDRARERRERIEATWLPPDPEIGRRDPTEDERTSGGVTLATTAREVGFTIRELFLRTSDRPTWKGAGVDAVFGAPICDFFTVAGLVQPLPLDTKSETSAWIASQPPGRLVAFSVTWKDRTAPTGRVYVRGRGWQSEGVTAILARLKALR